VELHPSNFNDVHHAFSISQTTLDYTQDLNFKSDLDLKFHH